MTKSHDGETSHLDIEQEHGTPLTKEQTAITLPTRIPYQQHLRDILSIASTIVLSEIFQNTLPLIDIAFVGKLPGNENLAAAGLATLWFNIWNTAMIGFTSAIDTLLAQSYGARDTEAFGMWTGTSLVLVLGATAVVSVLIACCEPMMLLFGQDALYAKMAGEFSMRLIPGLFPYYIFKVLVKYLQTQDRLLPGVIIGLLANGWNVLGNWFFIHKLEWGLNGAPWATTFTRLLECLLMIGYLCWKSRSSPQPSANTITTANNHHVSLIPPIFSIKHLTKCDNLMPFWALSINGALSMMAEAWSFEVTTILAGLLGTIQLDAHVVTLGIATFIFLSFPFAIGLASSIRIGQLIGGAGASTAVTCDNQNSNTWMDAQRLCVVSISFAFLVQGVLIAILLPMRKILVNWFVSDAEVAIMIQDLILLSGIFMLGDAFLASIGGALRGLGQQKINLYLNILGFWVVGVPSGALLTFVFDLGVNGLWIGMSVGIYMSSIIGLFILFKGIDWEKETEKAQHRISINQKEIKEATR